MGATCSKKSNLKTNPYAKNNDGYVVNSYNKPPVSVTTVSTTSASAVRNQQVKESGEKQEEANLVHQQPSKESFLLGSSNIGDEFYDGIPRYQSIKSRSIRRQAAVAKVSVVGSRLTRAGTVGLGKAVEVLDTLGSSMTNLNSNYGFASGVAAKGNELAILAFEVANTIVKGANLMQSLSERSVRQLKEEVLPSEGVQNLISKDMEELLRIVAADKREELKIFSGEVVRFGNRCKDPQWHNLDRYFEKIIREQTPHRQLPEEAESMIEPLMIFVQYTAELYHELLVLDRMELECQRKKDNPAANQKGESLAMLRAELKSQKKQVRNVKKKSLWSISLDEVMEKLVDIVHFLILEIDNAYVDGSVQIQESASNGIRLGPAGLSLHYANVVLQIDNLVARSSSMPPNSRETLYQNLPPGIKSALCSKLQSFVVKDELTIPDIKDEMEKTLQWLVPIATSTAKAHHGFGWVGEWASSGSEANRKPAAGVADIMRIETFHHADKEITEAYILELVLWLNHLISKTKGGPNGGAMPIKPRIGELAQKSNQQQKNESPTANKSPNATTLNIEDPVLVTGNQHQNNGSPNAFESSKAPTLTTDDTVPVTALLVDEMNPADSVDVLGYKGKHGLVTVKT